MLVALADRLTALPLVDLEVERRGFLDRLAAVLAERDRGKAGALERRARLPVVEGVPALLRLLDGK